jgi:hypothetical protein
MASAHRCTHPCSMACFRPIFVSWD